MRLIKYWLPVFLCMGIIFFASNIPGYRLPQAFSFQSVLYHFFAYMGLAWFLNRALKNTCPQIGIPQAFFLALIFAGLYGASDELHQLFIAGRSASIFDVFIDTLGSFLGCMLYSMKNNLFRRFIFSPEAGP